MKIVILIAALLLAGCGGGDDSSTSGQHRGVTDDTITLGSHTDLSGQLAIWGVPTTNGMRMRFDQVNDAGGIHGRMIKLVVEDSQYQVPAAVKATNKLINVDNIFLMIGAMGTPMNNAVTPRMIEAGVPNLFPITAAVSMYEPLHPMKFSYFVSYRDQARGAMMYMTKKHDIQKVCLQTLATDYGAEIGIGFDLAVEELGLEVSFRGSHKPTETDFIGTVTAIKNSGCEMLVLGPFIKDSIAIYTTARNAGWDAPIIGNMVPYLPEVARAPGGRMNGFYAAASFFLPDYEVAVVEDSWVGNWYQDYKQAFGDEPAPQAQIGYVIADLAVRAIEAAGRDLTAENVLLALENIDHYEDPFGGPSLSFSPTKHQGGDYLNLYQVVDGKWEVVEANLPF